MNNLFSLMLLPIWVLSFSLFSAVDHARTSPPLLSPIAGPVLPKENFTIASLLQPFSANPATMALAPSVVQMTEQQQHHHLDTEQHHHLGTGFLLVIIVVPIVVGSFIVSSICAWLYRRDHDKKSDLKPVQNSGLALGPILSKFSSLKMTAKKGSASMIDYSLLEAATNNFISSNVLGEGGFGCVYMARFDDNFVVAVKKLENRWQDSEREFENEVDLMSRIRHPNLVSLLGFCVHGQSRFLVYEFVHNGTLEEQLHGPSKGSALTWHLRMKIALDAARGLEYLHEHCSPPVIHRDLKSSNILLDSSCNAKLSDFGLAVTVGTQTKNNIKIMGSLGYVAPEYLLDGKLTEKSDVYAFGVILLELLMGRKPVEKMAQSQCQSIVTWAMPQFTDRTKLPHMVDPVIRNTMDLKHLYQVAAIAVLCVQLEPSYRSLIIDVLHSLMPLVPVELGGALRITEPQSPKDPNSCTSGP